MGNERTRRVLSCFVLLVLSLSLVPLDQPKDPHSPGEEPETSHPGPCPDSTPDGDCGDDCTCLCCPGHARILAETVVVLALFVHELPLTDVKAHLYSFELVSRVDRPPKPRPA
jgi:hypothetical protein